MPTVTIENRRFPSNTTIGPSGMFSLVNGSTNTFPAEELLTLPDPSNPGDFLTFRFLFWNILGDVHTSNAVPVGNVGSDDFVATAWYVQTGGSGASDPHVSTSAFSVAANQVVNTTPISSVTPAAAWPGGNSGVVDTTNSAVVIDAKNSISGESFNTWMVFGSGSAAGDDLSVAQNNSALAIASYKEAASVPGPRPDVEIHEVLDIFDRFRKHIGDWVADPAPLDLARVLSRVGEESGRKALEDELTQLTQNVRSLGKGDLQDAKAMLETRLGRLRSAQKLVDDAISRR